MRKHEKKSIFKEDEEDISITMFESLLNRSMSLQVVTSHEVVTLAYKFEKFPNIWQGLVSVFGKEGATKKIVDKISTFATNKRH